MAAPLIHVDGALTICARAHSLNTAGPTLAGSGRSVCERFFYMRTSPAAKSVPGVLSLN